MALYSRIKNWVDGTALLSADLNAEFNNILNNASAASTVGYSSNVAQMQTGADPGGVGTESLAASVSDELARLRFKLNQVIGGAQWYSTPLRNLTNLIATADIAAGAVTTANLDAGVSLMPTGCVLPFLGIDSAIPSGYLHCWGQAISRATYANLFTAIGTAYGVGDQSTTFQVPDLRGVFLRGTNGAATADPDAASRTSGPWEGSTWTLPITTVNTSPNVTCASTVNVAVGMALTATGITGTAMVLSITNSTTFVIDRNATASASVTATVTPGALGNNVGSYQTSAFAQHAHTVPISGTVNASGTVCAGSTSAMTASIVTSSVGISTETRPINVYVNYIIKV